MKMPARKPEVVVVGASAGGVEALLGLFGGLPAGYGLPLVAVLHLPDNRESLLPDLFARRLALRVKEAQDKEVLQPGTLYFAAPGYHLCIEADRSFSYSREEPVHFSRPSIDYLFESAADAYGAKAMGILLTGANQDGAAGLYTIKQRGGVTVVQDPQEAQVATMPEAALALHQPDYLLSLRGILALLAELDSRPC
ncbi:Chemotaxis response regulator protein-glutamate methylesterase [Pseudomonas sp. Bi70]|uniref:chemotaxis protein CheB n=2 Tax=unclassified Pseudomonas TaxID=196821 RepID=UPI000DAF4364|nr:chemotaxis protein CheB [Pseudomonas sp. URMO17WK12:I2]PZW49900.1 two-component system chemotaxis response regulator CheB [Pseudomonas sp. URMO17WK12:I2]CAH0212327.1 Chemotaxis response regulator protein-glutamate methylesterase [Pseudomonas sp. Bi70]